ncbi:MAG: NAD(+) synthase [Bacteroidales bacterium]|nr:NAD(+) synthase [Bacteroidales bacterium]MBP5517853.1 NAD(+) synthase [Bacteroidales bacterium]
MLIHKEFTIEEIRRKLVGGIRSYFEGCNMQKAVLGLSGGIDSAVVAALAVEALGSENVHGIMLPSDFSTLHSVQDAVDLAENLGIGYEVVPISEIYHKFMKSLEPVFKDRREWSVTEENLQARIRGTILMAYSNKFNALVLNTSNKSELCTGYGTLYGDLAGAMMVIADLYKGDVYELAYDINSEREIIPISTLTKAPSAELRPGQKDSDSLPDYDILDPILYEVNEGGKTFAQLREEGYSKELLDRISSLIGKSSFKIHQIPPILNISSAPVVYKEKCLLK